ncbi:MAG: hypothetical protein A2W31_05805 [Planctomycetes bacterium RBG_16_64_10]|nr:MAG: hypothetical protein A2W31_05805 [Planctomycetes bacterium RBG_16_64_10]
MGSASKPSHLSLTGPPARELKSFFERSGYVRLADLDRRKELTSRRYKKGYEVRIMVWNQDDLRRLRDLLRQVGFKAGRPFRKVNRWAQPVYGKVAVEWFLSGPEK